MRAATPLRTVSPFLQRTDSPATVSIRLAEPLWGAGERTELLVHCVQLHMLFEREAHLAATSADDPELSLDEICAHNPRVQTLLTGLGEASNAVEPGPDPLPVLEETGLSSMCPLVAHLLGDADEIYRDESVPLPDEYLDHITAINQLACTARQLRRDVLDRHFKYAAHKIALLYHAVNLSKVQRDVLRKRIEEHFEDIKSATENSVRRRRHAPLVPAPRRHTRLDAHRRVARRCATTNTRAAHAVPRPPPPRRAQDVPELPPELVAWVVELCDEILGVIRDVPPSVLSRLEPMLPLLLQPARESSFSRRGEDSPAR